jgi:hypothetical protein
MGAETMTPTVPATGLVVDTHGIAHQVDARGPWLYATACGANLPGPVVETYNGRQCGRCAGVMRARLAAAAKATTETQGRLFE